MDGLTLFFMILTLGFYVGGFCYFIKRAMKEEGIKKIQSEEEVKLK